MTSATTEKPITKTNPRARRAKPSTEALKALELEYFKKRRELERAEKARIRTEKASDVAESRKMIKILRKRYAMTDHQIIKRLGLRPTS